MAKQESIRSLSVYFIVVGALGLIFNIFCLVYAPNKISEVGAIAAMVLWGLFCCTGIFLAKLLPMRMNIVSGVIELGYIYAVLKALYATTGGISVLVQAAFVACIFLYAHSQAKRLAKEMTHNSIIPLRGSVDLDSMGPRIN